MKSFRLSVWVQGAEYELIEVVKEEALTLHEAREILEINDDEHKDVFFTLLEWTTK